jgi:polysaccharide chain length determinant protein (PEP-CTERM system associated)
VNITEILERVMDELRGAWRFRWLGFAAAWLICLVSWFAIYAIPDTYEANARVYVDSRGILRPLLEGLAIDPDVASGLDLVRQVLLSRKQVEQVAMDTGLDAMAKSPAQREQLISAIQSRISIDAADLRARTTQEGMYRISFRDQDRTKSIEVVQTMLKQFVENALGDKREGQASAKNFFDDQIAGYEKRMREAEDALADFKKRNVAVMPGSQGDYYVRLQDEIRGLEAARASLGIAESRRNEIQRQLDGEEPYLFGIDTGMQSGPAVTGAGAGDLTYRIQDVEKAIENLLLGYTDKHPEVVALRRTLDDLKTKQAEELARVKKGQAATGSLASSLKTNPQYQGLQSEQKRTQVQIAELRQEVAQRQARVAQLSGRVSTVPEIEAELTRLNRDYETVRQKYQELLQRRETAALSEDADRSGTVKFEVIEPPAASLEPVSPSRPRMLMMALVAALGAAGGLAWLMNQLNPVFHSAKSLEGATGLPVLASVSRTWLERHRRVRRLEVLKFSVGTALLGVAFVAVLMLQQPAARQLRQLIG